MNLQADLLVLLPELILAAGAMALLLLGAIGGEKATSAVNWGAIALLAAAGAALVCLVPVGASAFGGAFIADGFARFAKLLILLGAGLSILLAVEFFATSTLSRFELPVLMLIATLGMLLMVSSGSSNISSWAPCPPACCSTASLCFTASPAASNSPPSPR